MNLIKLFSVAFLVTNAVVVGINMQTFTQLDDDAVSINLAGRQRMLSQRMTKSALQSVEQQSAESQDEMRKSARTFDMTLRAFVDGGKTISAAGTEIVIPALTDEAHDIAKKALVKWEPISRILLNNTDIVSAKTSMLSNNAELLDMMNKMTVAIENSSKNKVAELRYIQTGLFALAVLLGILIFVSLFKQAKAATSNSKALFVALDKVNAGVLILDERGMIRHHNALAVNILDLSGASPMGKPLTSFIEEAGGGLWRISRIGKQPRTVSVTTSKPVADLENLQVVTILPYHGV